MANRAAHRSIRAGNRVVQNRRRAGYRHCAGRTDAGVHALEQVAHFDTQAERSVYGWTMGGNTQLPADIRIVWAQRAAFDFHARYSAIARFYRCIILNRPMKSALLRNQVTGCYQPLDAEKMRRAAQYLIGDHDFSSFRAQGCQSKSPGGIAIAYSAVYDLNAAHCPLVIAP